MTVTGIIHTPIIMIPGSTTPGTMIPGIMIHGTTVHGIMSLITTGHTITAPLTIAVPPM